MAERTETPSNAIRSVPPPPVERGRPTVPAAAAGDPASVRPHRNGGDRPDELRREIDATRARMSRTLALLEERMVREKRDLARSRDRIVAAATFQGLRRRMKEEPYRSMAIAFVLGYVVAAIRD